MKVQRALCNVRTESLSTVQANFRRENYFCEPMVLYLNESGNPEIYNREYHSKNSYSNEIIISEAILKECPGNDQTYITLLVYIFSSCLNVD
jgi:hypothetical protein